MLVRLGFVESLEIYSFITHFSLQGM
uniref:Uncharacterized protein n=1 Tax=Arundo donax TaxID=35708 RepID=A0A0A9FYE3_ARUDO